jgi:hypothetical protein
MELYMGCDTLVWTGGKTTRFPTETGGFFQLPRISRFIFWKLPSERLNNWLIMET